MLQIEIVNIKNVFQKRKTYEENKKNTLRKAFYFCGMCYGIVWLAMVLI